MEKKDIRIFVCVPAVGKSYLEMNDSHFIDMDRLKGMYKYGYPEDMTYKEFEATKSNREPVVHSDTTEYIRRRTHEEIKNGKYFLFAPNPAIVDMINEEKLPYCMVYASLDSIEFLAKRMKERGNIEKFISEMTKVAYEKYKFHKNDPRPTFKIELRKGEYLSDVIYDFLEIEKPAGMK